MQQLSSAGFVQQQKSFTQQTSQSGIPSSLRVQADQDGQTRGRVGQTSVETERRSPSFSSSRLTCKRMLSRWNRRRTDTGTHSTTTQLLADGETRSDNLKPAVFGQRPLPSPSSSSLSSSSFFSPSPLPCSSRPLEGSLNREVHRKQYRPASRATSWTHDSVRCLRRRAWSSGRTLTRALWSPTFLLISFSRCSEAVFEILSRALASR